MENLVEDLLKAIKTYDKERSLKICIDALEEKKIDICGLYEDILTPVLNNTIDEFKEENMLIWQEHLRSQIIISIIENAYPYVIKEKNEFNSNKKEKVIVLCPKFEEHLIGARMASDIFTIAGYETIFIGANTPWKSVLKAVEVIKPDIISISVTNFYNLVESKKTINIIKDKFNYKIRFILGGYAFKKINSEYKEIGEDIYIKKLSDIFSLKKISKWEVKR